MVEVAVGTLLVLSVVATFAVAPTQGTTAQLDAYAADALTALDAEPPVGAGATRLTALTRSAAAVDRERAAAEARLDDLLPPTVSFRVSTPHGSFGAPRPRSAPTGRATAVTHHGRLTVRVWYV